ncbi:LPS export ABC transporter periplasmic protein LptC [Thiohalorhabdus methylotrophus]|uniref:LPS export ABC transporter periplasmic protein LptC n=1 Tax=Thiohalorhabdus methylotrophus TaxID=3242694 RepID=A0ABV4TTA3_9GAMM
MSAARTGRIRPPGGRPFLLTLAVAVAVGLGVALLWQDREEGPAAVEEAGPVVDVEAWSVRLRQRATDGDQWWLNADHAAHFPEHGYTRLRTVHLEVSRPSGPPLTVRSRTGRVADDSNQVTLKGDVRVTDPEGYRMTTKTLHYFPDEQRARTNDPVRVTAEFGTADGIGATVWTDERRVEIHEQVNTTFWKIPRGSG